MQLTHTITPFMSSRAWPRLYRIRTHLFTQLFGLARQKLMVFQQGQGKTSAAELHVSGVGRQRFERVLGLGGLWGLRRVLELRESGFAGAAGSPLS